MTRRILLCLLTLTVGLVLAVPRYTSYDNVSCAACHVNPEGGGMRTSYANYRFDREDPLEIEISKNLRFDAEARFYAMGSKEETAEKGNFTFNVMDYRMRLNPHYKDLIDAVVSVSRFGFDEASLRVWLPEGFYAKAGLYRPAFGMNEDDHYLSTKDPFGFDTLTWFETGLELGWFNGDTHIALGAYNGGEDFLDITHGKAVSAYASQRLGPVYFGGSYWYEEEEDIVSGLFGTRWAADGFLMIDLPWNLGILGEFLFNEERKAGVYDYIADYAYWGGLDAWIGPVELYVGYDAIARASQDVGHDPAGDKDQQYITGRAIWHAMSYLDLELGIKRGLHDDPRHYFWFQLWSTF
jgi:hypothetical protein